MSLRPVVLGLLVLVGCAHAPENRAPRRAGMSASSARIYAAGEEQYAAGRYAAAAALFRHALLQLPETAEADGLRHRLILRIGFTMVRAHHRDGDRTLLVDARRMLVRYLDKHRGLFGDTRRARAERDEVRQQLALVQRRLDASPSEGAPAPTPTDAPHPPPATATAAAEPSPAMSVTHVDEDYRIIRVPRVPKNSVDNPAMRAKLSSPFSDHESGLLFGGYGTSRIHGPRPLVRARAASRVDRPDADAAARKRTRELGTQVVREAREALRSCFASAYERRPIDVAEPVVEVTVAPSGEVSKVRIVDGGLVDAMGDVCLVERLAVTRVAAVGGDRAVRLRVPLVFFYEPAVDVNEFEFFFVPKGWGIAPPAQPGEGGFQTIDEGAVDHRGTMTA
jgi:hypothetical protein